MSCTMFKWYYNNILFKKKSYINIYKWCIIKIILKLSLPESDIILLFITSCYFNKLLFSVWLTLALSFSKKKKTLVLSLGLGISTCWSELSCGLDYYFLTLAWGLIKN